jgi:predicted Zn-dependent peptidase
MPRDRTQISDDVSRMVLDNGLRVLLAPDRELPRVAVSVHYRVGFRSESPRQAGLAHLFEHLMFRGSENLPAGLFQDHVAELGGEASGTTHCDYTDYFQVVPVCGLERALFSEADRMRAPRFTKESLVEQLHGVESEIRQQTVDRPYGGFPWPLLPGVLYGRYANAHDGYGDPVALRNTTLADCEEFFDTHYLPGNAVLTVVGGFRPERVARLVERHFGGIAARPVPPEPELAEPPLAADRLVTCREPGIATSAVAVGYRLPDPRTELYRYLAHLVLGELLAADVSGPGGGQASRINASCGYFGPLDARDPDTLVLAMMLPRRAAADRALAAVDRRLRWWADGGSGREGLGPAVRRLVWRHHRGHAHPRERCRALGRLEALFDQCTLLEELPARLAAVNVAEVAEAATGLRSVHRAVLVIEPGPDRCRPVPAAPPALPDLPDGPAPAMPVARGNVSRRDGPGPVPALGAVARPRYGGFRDVVLDSGPRVVAVRYGQAPVVELRLRIPLPPAGGAGGPDDLAPRLAEQPAAPPAEHLAHALALATGGPQRADRLAGDLTVTGEGRLLTIAGYAPAEASAAWLDILADLVTTTGFSEPVAAEAARRAVAGSARRTPRQLVDAGMRHRLVGEPLVLPGPPADPGRLAPLAPAAALAPAGAVLVAVGDLDPERFVARVARSLSGWTRPGHPARPRGGAPPPQDIPAGPLVLPAPGLHRVELALFARVPAGSDDAARQLAIAILGGYHGCRLRRLVTSADPDPGHAALAGRDTVAGEPHVYVRASLPAPEVPEALAGIHRELLRMGSAPPGACEVATASAYCAAELLSVFDSPADLADHLPRMVSNGLDPARLVRVPDALRATGPERVAAAGAELFAEPTFDLVIVGEVDAGDLAAAAPRAVASRAVPARALLRSGRR